MSERPTTNTTATAKPQQNHASATATSSNNNNQSPVKKKLDASCRSCARLVQSILNNPDSRPRQVLQSLVGFSTLQQQQQPSFQVRPLEDGVQVEMRVPDLPYTPPKLWKQVAPPEEDNSSSSGLGSPLSLPVLATSAKVTRPKYYSNKFTTETIKIECRPCDTVGPEQGARALIMGPNPLSIVACTNRLTPGDKEEMSQVLVHELIHAYDVKQLQLDFTDCESMAYSEVRAAREAECYIDPSRSWQQPSFLKEYCVKQKAIAATHNLFPSKGRKCVRAVFDAAYSDARPFNVVDLKHYVQKQQQNQSKLYQPNRQDPNAHSSR